MRVHPQVLVAALALALAAPIAARQEPRPSTYARNIVLQVEREPDYSASDLGRLLADDTYLGALAPNLITVAGLKALPSSYIPAGGLITLVTNQGSPEILTLAFSGQDQRAVNDAADKVVHHLQSLVPTRRRQSQDQYVRATAALETAKTERDQAMRAVSKFKQQYGADIDQQLRDSQDRLRRNRNDLSDLMDKLSQMSATRDYLRKAVEEAAKTAASDSSASDLTSVRQQLATAQKDLQDLKTRYSDEHPSVVKAKAQVEQIGKQIELLSQGAGAPSRGNLEARLFDTEQDVFELERRRDWLKSQLEAMAVEQSKLIELTEQVRALSDAQQLASMRFDEARNSVTTLERGLANMAQGPWIHVLAGG